MVVYASRAHGTHGSGARDYDGKQAASVRHVLRGHVGAASAVTVDELARATGIGGRTVRAVLSDLDGRDFVLGVAGDGVYVCETADEADGLTAKLESQARKMGERVERRRAFAAGLPRSQGYLFG